MDGTIGKVVEIDRRIAMLKRQIQETAQRITAAASAAAEEAASDRLREEEEALEALERERQKLVDLLPLSG